MKDADFMAPDALRSNPDLHQLAEHDYLRDHEWWTELNRATKDCRVSAIAEAFGYENQQSAQNLRTDARRIGRALTFVDVPKQKIERPEIGKRGPKNKVKAS